jgi:ABC-type transporter Mla MlaB component
MAKKSKSMIGHDPLAWLKEDAEDAEFIEEVKPAKKAKKKTAKKTTAKEKTKSKSTTKDTIFEIQSVQDISSVAELHKELKKLLNYEKVILDGGNIERIDTASLQLIFAWLEEAKNNNIEVSWRSPSEALLNSVGLVGMKDVLLLDNVA